MVAVLAFIFSLLALGGLLVFKRAELERGMVHAPHFRARADAFVLENIRRVAQNLPRPHPDWLKRILRSGAHTATLLLLRGVRLLEQRLLGLVNMIKGRGTIVRGDGVSEYLKSVGEHKKKGKEKGRIVE